MNSVQRPIVYRLAQIAFLGALMVLAACTGSSSNDQPLPPPVSPAPPVPNAAPSNVRLMEVSSMAAGQLTASWLPAADDTTPNSALRYEVHASTESGFAPTATTLRSQTTGTVSVVITSGLTRGQRHEVRLVAIDQQDARTVSAPLSVLVAETSGTLVPGVAVRTLSSAETAEVRPNELVLATGLNAPAVGSIVASGEGTGFLRRVTGISNAAGRTVLATERVALDEVVSGVQLSASIRLPAVPQQTGAGAPGQVRGLNVSQPASGVTRFEWPEADYVYEAGTVQPPANRQSILSANRPLSGLPTRFDIGPRETMSGAFMQVIAPTRINMETAALVPIQFAINTTRDLVPSGVNNGSASICDVKVEAITGGNMAANSFALSALEVGVLIPTSRETATGRVLGATKSFSITPGANGASEAFYTIRFRATVQDIGDNCRTSSQPGRLPWREQIDFLVYVLVNDNPFPSREASYEDIEGTVQGSGSLRVTSNATVSFDPVLSYGLASRASGDDVFVIELEAAPMIDQVLSIRGDVAGRFERNSAFIQPRRFFKVVIAPGGVPIVVSGIFEIELNISGSVTGALTAEETLRIGYQKLSYKMECRRFPVGECVPSSTKEPIAELKVAGQGRAEGRVVVKLVPKMRVKLYEAATAHLTLEAAVTVEAGVEGLVLLNTAFNPDLGVPNIAFDADYRLTKASLNFGATAFLFADLTVFDRQWYVWPSGAVPDAYTTHHPIPLLNRTLAALPGISALEDRAAVNPTNLAAILVRARHENWRNPLFALIPSMPESFFPWRRWTQPKVMGPLSASRNGYGFVSDPLLPDGQYWVTFTEPGNYVVRVGGFSSWGSWARQYTEITIAVTDANGNGVLDHVEARDPTLAVAVATGSCTAPVVGALMTCTVTGANLPATTTFSAVNCAPNPMTPVVGGTSASRSFTCTPVSQGVAVAVSYSVPGFLGPLPFVTALPAAPNPSTVDHRFGGRWVGTVNATGSSVLIYYSLELTQIGSTVTGTIDIGDSPDYARFTMRGGISGNVLSFEGSSVIERTTSAFCLASGSLTLSLEAGVPHLIGTYGPLAVPNGCPPGSSGNIRLRKMLSGLNDSGITVSQCYSDRSITLVGCTSPEAIALSAQQDGMIGRDVTLNDMSDGAVGFSYSVVGKPIGGSYAKTECIRDNVTGLVWEGKTSDGGFRDGSKRYPRLSGVNNLLRAYVDSVNASALCGFTDWREPTASELLGLVDFGLEGSGPAVDLIWLPNTASEAYWTSQTHAGLGFLSQSWVVQFNREFSQRVFWRGGITGDSAVRLVR